MTSIKALIRNGHVETAVPIDLPEGTEVMIVPSILRDDVGDDWDDSPTGIAAWLKAYEGLQPLVFTPEERSALAQDLAARKEWDLANAEERDRKLRKIWE